MDLLNDELDFDPIIKLIEDSKNAYSSLKKHLNTNEHNKYMLYILYILLKTPKKSIIENLLSNTQDNLQFFIEKFKRLIKGKYMQLNCQENIIKIVNILNKTVGRGEILDTLIINCLRYGSYSKYVELIDAENTFLLFYKNNDKNKLFDVFGRDYNFKQTFEEITRGAETYSQYCSYKTQKQFLIAKICPELEINIIFYLEQVFQHFNIYENWLFQYYIINNEVAKNIIRYLVAVYFTNNVNNLIRLIFTIFNAFNGDYIFIAIFYDAFLHENDDSVNTFLVSLILEDLSQNNIFTSYFMKFLANKTLRYRFVNFLEASKLQTDSILDAFNLKNINIIDRVISTLETMNFDSYYRIIDNIKQNNEPFIDIKLYSEIIKLSNSWDGYMQIFLWKIFMHQKIHFNFMPEHQNLETKEGIEGFELLMHLNSKKNI